MVVVRAKVIDATHLELSNPIPGPLGRQVVVSVADSSNEDADRESWRSLSAEGLASAYADSEPEYQTSMLKEPNTEYEE